MKYIMVTNFENHWDKIPNNRTSYTLSMLKGKMSKDNLVPGTETIFIKRKKGGGGLEGAWQGKVIDFEKAGEEKKKQFILQ